MLEIHGQFLELLILHFELYNLKIIIFFPQNDIDKLVSENRIDKVTAWLTEKIHKYGMLLTPAQLIENACGEEFNADYYIEYLTEKYKKIYDLK